MFAGLQLLAQCWCGNEAPPPESEVGKSNCNFPCTGDVTKKCGGFDQTIGAVFMNVYKHKNLDTGTDSEESSEETGDKSN